MLNLCQIIKDDLQVFFDIPFDVKERIEYQDPVFVISPHNELDELFQVKIFLRQKIRLIVEIEPQKYSAAMMESINNIDLGKRHVFLGYVKEIQSKGAKIEFFVNKQPRDIRLDETWNEHWNVFRIRATQIVEERMTEEQESALMREWSRLSVGLLLSLLEVENISETQHSEGKIYQVIQNRYERNPINRELCLSANGYCCKICGFDFEKVYGVLGREFIHVHHIEMVSSFGGKYYLDPTEDMIPVCPNCHAMLHRENPPIMPDKLKEIIKYQRAIKGDES